MRAAILVLAMYYKFYYTTNVLYNLTIVKCFDTYFMTKNATPY